MIAARGHETNFHSRPDDAVNHAKQDNHAAIRVVPRIENEGLQRRGGIAPGRRHVAHDALQNFVHALAGFSARQDHVVRAQPDEVFDLLDCFFGFRAGQVDLVDNRN